MTEPARIVAVIERHGNCGWHWENRITGRDCVTVSYIRALMACEQSLTREGITFEWLSVIPGRKYEAREKPT